ncbi:MAG: hypothetical protein K2P77_04550, partial [Burkholderiaceae bacterium]|nr:hypothetical protein [Burkholderiaceae bacterium]
MQHHSSRPAVKRSVIAIHSALAALGALAISLPVQAQTENQPSAPVETPAPAAAGPLQSVVVSASRIDRAGYSAPTPTVSVGAATLEQRATVNIGDVLNEIPAFRASQTPAGGGIGN